MSRRGKTRFQGSETRFQVGKNTFPAFGNAFPRFENAMQGQQNAIPPFAKPISRDANRVSRSLKHVSRAKLQRPDRSKRVSRDAKHAVKSTGKVEFLRRRCSRGNDLFSTVRSRAFGLRCSGVAIWIRSGGNRERFIQRSRIQT